jgi:hypothetical protein
MKTIKINGEIHKAAAERLRRDLDAAHGDEVTLEIDSHGGNFIAGLKMYAELQEYPAKTVARVIHAGSAATLPLCGCTEAVNTEKGTVFVHAPTATAVKDIGLSIGDMQEAIGSLQRTTRILANIYALKDPGGFPMHRAPGVWETMMQRKGGTTWGPGGKARLCDSWEKPDASRPVSNTQYQEPVPPGLLGEVAAGALAAGLEHGARIAAASVAKRENGKPKPLREAGQPFAW